MLAGFLVYPAIAVISTAAGAAYMIYRKPGILVKFFMKLMLYRSGMKVKHVTVGNYNYCYAERGEMNVRKSSLLLIHGFSASKDMFVPVFRKLPKDQDQHIVALDLPGHGESTIPTEGEDISVDALAHHIKQVKKEVRSLWQTCSEARVCMGDYSMGGTIAGLYTALYPDDIFKLTLVCPALQTPVETDFIREMREGECRLLPETPEQMQYMIDSTLYHKQKFNKQVLKGFLQMRHPKAEFNKRLFLELSGSMKDQESYVVKYREELHAPTQLIWGKQDELIHISGAAMLKEILPNCQRVDLLDDCGHSVCMDRAGLLTKCLLQFRGELVQGSKLD